jgi:hypothetical protein
MNLSGNTGYTALLSALDQSLFLAAPDGERVAPDDILTFLARLRMLEGVPFNTLVPDADLLPVESIRFFYLDRAWTDALVQGALSVGSANSIERAQLERLYPQIEEEIDETERRVRSPGGEPTLGGSAGIVTGFLLRSEAVAGWPGLHIRAYDTEPEGDDEDILPESHPDRVKLLRLERLAPSVLLALFDGIPDVLHIEEPRQGVQFGVRLEDQGRGRWQAFVPARDVRTAGYVDDDGEGVEVSEDAAPMPVRFRPGAAGVLDLSNTGRAFAGFDGTGMTEPGSEPIDGAEFAMQMLRFPYRQVFAQSTTTPSIQDAAFVPGLGLGATPVSTGYAEILRARLEED